MNELNNTLLKLLRSVLLNEPLDKGEIPLLDNEKLTQLYQIAKKHDMAHILAVAIDKAGVAVEPELAKKLRKQQMLAIYRYENIKYELDAISAALDRENIPYIPLKGAVIRELYPQPWMRTSCDIDVLVHREELDRAVSLLTEALGYERMEKDESHDVSLFSQSGVHLELHFCLKEEIDAADEILNRVWDYADSDGRGGCGCVLSPEFFLYYHTVHALCHFLIGGCGIRSVYDLHLLRRAADYDENEVRDLCRRAGIERFYRELCLLSDAWFSFGERTEISEKIEDFIMDGGVFGNATNHYSVKQGAAGGRARYLGKRIFVSYDYLKKQYPSMKSKALMPMYQVRRWIDAIGKGRVSRSLEEMKFTNSLDDGYVSEVISLMTELEIEKYIK